MIKSVIFDFDDTLIDNKELDYQGFVIPCLKLGLPLPTSKQIFHLRKNNFLAKDITINLRNRSKKQFSIKNFLSLRSTFLQSKESIPFLYLKIGTKSLLSFLKDNKIKCFLCSVRQNKQTILDFLRKNKIHNYFSNVYVMKDIGVEIENFNMSNRKLIKNSLIYKIIKNTQCVPNEIVFVGNSKEDLNSALDMHVNFIYYKNSYLKEININDIIKVQTMTDLRRQIIFLQYRSI
jgi:phosphoglycolate phosphatase-like HAD superfamily hydrolase